MKLLSDISLFRILLVLFFLGIFFYRSYSLYQVEENKKNQYSTSPVPVLGDFKNKNTIPQMRVPFRTNP